MAAAAGWPGGAGGAGGGPGVRAGGTVGVKGGPVTGVPATAVGAGVSAGVGALGWGSGGWLTGVQYSAAGCLAFLGANWLAASAARLRVGVRGGRSGGSGPADPSSRPGCTVVLPVKGCNRGRAHNGAHQLCSDYPGAVEFIFVVESTRDPAYAVALDLEFTQTAPGPRSVRVVVAGRATNSSQKIHNMLEGVKQSAKSSKYVLFLDDDVRAHPQLINHLQAALEDDPKVFMATGYPLDLVPPGSNLWAHAAAAFHLVLVPAMSHGRTFFAWGGCMMFRQDDLVRDAYGLVSAWRNGGYSDDLIAGTKCFEHGLKIACPEAAHMFQLLDREWTRAKFWNYIRRQLFVLTTYTNPFSYRFHALLLFTNALFFATIILGLAVSALAALPFDVLPTVLEFGPEHRYLSVVVLSTALMSLAALGLMHGVVVSASAAWLRQPPKGLELWRFDWKLTALGFLTMAVASPPAALLGALRDTIVWSGISYTRRQGLVARVRPLQ